MMPACRRSRRVAKRARLLPVVVLLLVAGSSCLAQDVSADAALARVRKLNKQAGELSKAGNHAQAEALFKRALALAETTLGPDHPEVAMTLIRLALLQIQQKRYGEAEPLYLRALPILEKVLGAGHPSVAKFLNDLAGLRVKQRKYSEAEPLLKRALAIREKALGLDHADVATSLSRIALLYEAQGRYAEAEPLYLRAIQIKERTLGLDHALVATSLNDLALLLMERGNHREAEPLLLRAITITETALGPEHPDVATWIANLGTLYLDKGKYREAEEFLLRATMIEEKAFGPEHPRVMTSLGNVAMLYLKQGKYAEAESLLFRVLAIEEKALGPEHPDVVASLSNIAGLNMERGNYAEAEPLHIRVLAIREKVLGPYHPDTATAVNNLAGLYVEQGEYAKAEPLLKRTLAIRENTLGPEHSNTARALCNLAGLYKEQGRYSEAETLHAQAMTIKEKALGPNHVEVALSLNGLALVYAAQERYADAESLLERALTIRRNALGPSHTYVATSLINLGVLCGAQGKYAEAERLYARALAIFERAADPEHPHAAIAFRNLSRLALGRGDLDACWRYADHAREVLLQSRARSGRSALARSSFFGERGASDLVPCLALVLNKEKDVLELLEQGRALGLREMLAEARASTDAALPPEDRRRVAAALGRINALNALIEKAAQKGLPDDALREDVRRAEREYDSLVAIIGERTGGLAAVEPGKAITSKEAAQSPALDETTAIVGWTQSRNWTWGYVITQSGVEWVDLSGTAEPKSTVALIRRVIDSTSTRNVAMPSENLAELYRRMFAPLETHLTGVKKLIVISHGWSALLPVEILLTEQPSEGETDVARWPWLGERYEVSYAPSVTTLDVLCRKAVEERRDQWERPLLALADPPFSEEQLAGMTSDEDGPDVAELAMATDAEDDALSRLVRYDPRAVPARIPGTRFEVEMIAKLEGMGGALLLLGPDASERRLFEASASGELSRCRYVHLATHGYADGERPELSCLVLARAPRDEEHDGRLDMREVFHLKLDADLVVLSACQSGLGKHLGGEGMVGLSTAFFFAGTSSVVVSLWQVSDVSTALLMRRFYGNLSEGRSKSAALSEAKAWLRNLSRSDLEKLRRTSAEPGNVTRGLGQPQRVDKGELSDDKPFAHPYFWAPFVLTGDSE